MSIRDKALLIQVSVSGWTARKLDRKVTEEVDRNHGAKDAGRYNKLLVDKEALDPVLQQASAIRAFHHKMTLPWQDGGIRLLPSKLFMAYRKDLQAHIHEFDARVAKFIDLYERELVGQARNRLGTLYDPLDYPPASSLRKKFSVDIDEFPVPSAEDFRVDVGDAERERIRQDMERRLQQRQDEAMADAWGRIREAVGRYTKIGGDKAKIYDSMVENAEELTRLLPGLNIADDPQMDRVCQAIIDRLIVSPNALRNSVKARKALVAEAEGILAMCPRKDAE